MKIGSRIPIATGSYQTGAATAVVSSLVNTQFQYLDVGVNIEKTPTVHFDHDVTLKVKIEVTSQSNSVTISGVTEPIISQRVVDQVIRLREGEANILGGIQEKQDQIASSGIPGLGSIPILKYIFGNRDHTITDDEIVFVVVPHIVRSPDLASVNLRTIDTGVGQAIELRHVASEGAILVPPSAPGSTPAPVPVRPHGQDSACRGRHPRSNRRSRCARSSCPVARSREFRRGSNGPDFAAYLTTCRTVRSAGTGKCGLRTHSANYSSGRRLHLPRSYHAERRNGYCVCSLANSI